MVVGSATKVVIAVTTVVVQLSGSSQSAQVEEAGSTGLVVVVEVVVVQSTQVDEAGSTGLVVVEVVVVQSAQVVDEATTGLVVVVVVVVVVSSQAGMARALVARAATAANVTFILICGWW